MMKILLILALIFHLPSIVRSQNTEDVSVKIYYLMATTPWDITIEVFDSTFINSKYCKSTIIEDSYEVSKFISELSSNSDTIFIRNNNYYEKTDTVKDRRYSTLAYPEMDTRGKIIIMTPKGNKIFYYSLNFIWDATDNKLYKISEKLRAMIIRQFFPKEMTKKWKSKKRN